MGFNIQILMLEFLMNKKELKIKDIENLKEQIDGYEFEFSQYKNKGNIEFSQEYLKRYEMGKEELLNQPKKLKEINEHIENIIFDPCSKKTSEYLTKAEYYKKLYDSCNLGFKAFEDEDVKQEIEKLTESWEKSYLYNKKLAKSYDSTMRLELVKYCWELSELCKLSLESSIEASHDVNIKLNKLLEVAGSTWSEDAKKYSISAKFYKKLSEMCKLDYDDFYNELERLEKFFNENEKYIL